MAFIDWNESLVTGVAETDAEHRLLIDAINGLHEGMLQGKGRDALAQRFSLVVAHAGSHFKNEEVRMQRAGFDGLSDHRRVHLHLLDQLHAFQKQYAAGELAVSMEFMQFLRNWLVNHIHVLDTQMARHFAAHGMAGNPAANPADE